jgi:hypothetical protein
MVFWIVTPCGLVVASIRTFRMILLPSFSGLNFSRARMLSVYTKSLPGRWPIGLTGRRGDRTRSEPMGTVRYKGHQATVSSLCSFQRENQNIKSLSQLSSSVDLVCSLLQLCFQKKFISRLRMLWFSKGITFCRPIYCVSRPGPMCCVCQ